MVNNININRDPMRKSQELGLQNAKIRLDKEISEIQVKAENILSEIHERLRILNSLLKKTEIKIAELEDKCKDNMESMILRVLTLLVSLSEYKKVISE